MPPVRIFTTLLAGVTGLGTSYIFLEERRVGRLIHALSYGRHSYNTEKAAKWDSNWDCREPILKEDETKSENANQGELKTDIPTATRHLFLIRHGQYVMDKDSDKKVLTELGRQQAITTGKRLKELGLPYKALHHSTMIRAIETAELVSQSLPHVPVKSTEILCEGAPIRPEPEITHWKPEKWQYFQDGARIETAFRQFFHRAPLDQKEDSYEILICHANVIRYFVCRALQIPPEAWLRMSIGNCGITKISIRPNGRVSLKTMGDTGHLPPDMITFS